MSNIENSPIQSEQLPVPEIPEVGMGLTLHEIPDSLYSKTRQIPNQGEVQEMLPKEQYLKNYNVWLQALSKKYPDASVQAHFTEQFPSRYPSIDKYPRTAKLVILKRQ